MKKEVKTTLDEICFDILLNQSVMYWKMKFTIRKLEDGKKLRIKLVIKTK